MRARRGGKQEDRYPIGVWRHLVDDAYNGGKRAKPGISRAIAASNGHAQQRDNSICRAIMRVGIYPEPDPTRRRHRSHRVLSYFALVFPSRDQSGYVAVLADRDSDNNYLFDALRYARYSAEPHPLPILPLPNLRFLFFHSTRIDRSETARSKRVIYALFVLIAKLPWNFEENQLNFTIRKIGER